MSHGGGFVPNVTRHGGNEGDERTRELWEQWSTVAGLERDLRRAKENTKKTEQQAQFARNHETDMSNKLREARAGLDRMLDAEKGKP